MRVNPVLRHAGERWISLDGEWEFALDREDEGRQNGWFMESQNLPGLVKVPGCWQGQGHGYDGTDTIWDFRLETRVFRATYEGTAWYRKKFRVPEGWREGRIWVNFGGVHPSAEVWLNETLLGTHSAPFVPFAYDASDLVREGEDNSLVVRVHEKDRWLGLSYNWQGKWSGLYRSVELTATGDSWLEKLWLRGDPDSECLRVRALTGAAGDATLKTALVISVEAPDGGVVATHRHSLVPNQEGRFNIPIDEPPASWSPEAPNLYTVHAQLLDDRRVLDAASERIGFVKLSTHGKHFLINNEPYYMRGTGDFSACPETGSPDTDRDRWRRKLGDLRRYGYNYVRCQSYAPTPEYLDVADEVGLLVQGEMGMLGAWAGSSPWHVYAWPRPSPGFYEKLKWQWDRTVMRDINHPSAAIYCMSNELGKDTLYPGTAWKCYRDTKALKPQSMVIWTDGGYSRDLPGDFVNAEASLDGECDKPLIQHEFRWWSAYPDPRTKGKFSGAVRPYAIELAERNAGENHVAGLLQVMAESSQRLQYIEARGKLEACRRDNPTLGGICHFNAMDIGYSPQGILDEFYDPKLTSPETWLRTWGDVVIMIDRDFQDRVLQSGTKLSCRLYISDFSHPPLSGPELKWEFLLNGHPSASGTVGYRHRPHRTIRAGRILLQVPEVSKPSKATLRAALTGEKGAYMNEWEFWVMPEDAPRELSARVYRPTRRTWLRQLKSYKTLGPQDVLYNEQSPVLADAIDKALLRYMEEGGVVVLAAPEGFLRPFTPKLGLTAGRYFFLPPANYPPYEDGQSGTIIANHPMMGDLPHEGYADLVLHRPIAESPPIDLGLLGGWGITPVIRAMSTYFVFHPLAYLAEFRVGKGGLIISALNLDQSWPESRVLLASILNHAAGPAFRPRDILSAAAKASLVDMSER